MADPGQMRMEHDDLDLPIKAFAGWCVECLKRERTRGGSLCDLCRAVARRAREAALPQSTPAPRPQAPPQVSWDPLLAAALAKPGEWVLLLGNHSPATIDRVSSPTPRHLWAFRTQETGIKTGRFYLFAKYLKESA